MRMHISYISNPDWKNKINKSLKNHYTFCLCNRPTIVMILNFISFPTGVDSHHTLPAHKA